jgi:hypothetical protein
MGGLGSGARAQDKRMGQVQWHFHGKAEATAEEAEET